MRDQRTWCIPLPHPDDRMSTQFDTVNASCAQKASATSLPWALHEFDQELPLGLPTIVSGTLQLPWRYFEPFKVAYIFGRRSFWCFTHTLTHISNGIVGRLIESDLLFVFTHGFDTHSDFTHRFASYRRHHRRTRCSRVRLALEGGTSGSILVGSTCWDVVQSTHLGLSCREWIGHPGLGTARKIFRENNRIPSVVV